MIWRILGLFRLENVKIKRFTDRKHVLERKPRLNISLRMPEKSQRIKVFNNTEVYLKSTGIQLKDPLSHISMSQKQRWNYPGKIYEGGLSYLMK